MKRIIRDRFLTDEEAEKYQKIREQVEKEFLPSLNQERVSMTPATVQGKKQALEQLAARRANQPKQIDNASLYAGSPMYFYCKSCGHLADTKPESYFTPVKKLCNECQALKDLGWLE